ncbi:MAG: crosslink repair DNA glycosylase YcaQ family protein, partial [Candidatus Phosphoribacter sp.]
MTALDLQRVIDRVGAVQIDSVTVLARSHYLPFFSRLGAYDTAVLDRMRDEPPRRLVEYRAHEAALVAPGTWPLLAHRMRDAERTSWGELKRLRAEQPAFLEIVRELVVAHGPMTSRDVEVA